ncbi:MAG: PAS domain S-box protein [Mariprofundales bacterium]|nr:PAS domain S-box protein [Mariprofundales bacterium]
MNSQDISNQFSASLLASGDANVLISRIINTMVDAVLVHQDGHFVFVNQAAATLLGADSPQQLIGYPVMDCVDSESRANVMARIQQMMEQQGATAALMEHCLLKLDGSRFYAELQASRLEGDPPMVLVVARDITERKRSERQIHMLSQTIEHMNASVCITDNKGVVIYANRASAKMYDLTPEQMVGHSAAELRGGQNNDLIYQEIAAQLGRGKSWHQELEITTKNGDKRILDRVIFPIPDSHSGELIFYACIDRDITELRQQRSQLEHTQRLESLGVLAGGIAHDFNNILTAIMGNAELATTKLASNPIAAHTNLIRISQSSERAAKLCQQMLAYAGKGHFIVQPLDLSVEVRTMSSLLQVSLGKQVHLTFKLDDALPAIQADEAQIQQVIMNLITNANEAMDGSMAGAKQNAGTITLRTGIKQVSARWLRGCVGNEEPRPGKYVFIQVSDEGCGMDAATQAKIFDPFFTTKFTGRGLGMSAILGIIQGHHGYLRLESQLDKGTTFTLLFPPTEQSVSVAEEAGDPVALLPAAGRMVLIVDDEEPIREAAGMMLSDAGFSTRIACDGAEAVKVFEQSHEEIDVVLLDLTMPQMDGETALLALRKIDPTVRVLISSGYSSSELASRFAKQHLSGFVHKPYTPQQLIAAVGQALSDQ